LFDTTCDHCKDDVAGKALRFIYGKSLKEQDLKYYEKGGLFAFDQSNTSYTSPDDARMNSYGFIYVPFACNNNATTNVTCVTHVNFHGCTQTAAWVKTAYMRDTGLLEYASLNNIIMIFPQNFDTDSVPYEHCWATMGTADSKLPQIQAIQAQLTAIFGVDLFDNNTTPLTKYKEKPWLKYVQSGSLMSVRLGYLLSIVSMIYYLA